MIVEREVLRDLVTGQTVDLGIRIEKLADRPRTGLRAREEHESVSVGDAHEGR